MTVKEKMKTIGNKMEQNKAQFRLDRPAANIFALSSGNVNKHEFWTGKDVLTEKDWVEKAGTMKGFYYFALGKELKAQTDIAKKQYQAFGKTFETGETINKKSKHLKTIAE